MASEQKTEEVRAIEGRIESYLDEHRNKIEVNLGNTPLEFSQHSGTLFTAGQDKVAMTLGFKDGNIKKNDSLEKLRSNFNFVALDRLPVPGLSGVPAQWEIYPQTPISSFSEGVTFESYDPQTQVLAVRVQTNFFAIYGRIPQEHPIADRGAPAGTYLQVRRDIQGDIRVHAKLVFA